jgi:uncharacterized protein
MAANFDEYHRGKFVHRKHLLEATMISDETPARLLSQEPKTRFLLWLILCAACVIIVLLLQKIPPAGTSKVLADPPPMPRVQPGSLKSQVLGEERTYTVYLPDGYDLSQRRYPVLFLLDGPRHSGYATSMAEYLARYPEGIPPIIIVDILQQHRSRDMTPTPGKENPGDTGGADRFLAFLSKELVPDIQSHYRTRSPLAISGHCLSGLFAIHALLTQPELFDGYITASPCLWWDDSLLVRRANDFFKSHETLERKLFLGIGAGEQQAMQDYFNQMSRIFEANTPKGFQVGMRRFDGESHGTICIPTMYYGLKFVFATTATNETQRL